MTAEQKLRQIAKIYNRRRKVGERQFVESHAYYNLEGAIIDIERTGECDRVSMKTLKRVRDQLGKIGQIIGE